MPPDPSAAKGGMHLPPLVPLAPPAVPYNNGPLPMASTRRSAHAKNTAPTRSAATTQPAFLDIYAISYVPLWLKVVNQCHATSRNCLPLNSLGFHNYITTFAGSDFLGDLPVTEIPPATYVNVDSEALLKPGTYRTQLRAQVQNECAAQAAALQQYYLYNVRLESHNPKEQLYRLAIPGLREKAPCVDLGDVVLVRPIVPPRDEMSASAVANAFCKGEITTFPFYFGIEYRAVVWGLSKLTEHIILRLDDYPPLLDCNVIFTLQEQQIAAQIRGIDSLSYGLASKHRKHRGQGSSKMLAEDSRASCPSWTRSMLFPDNSDTVVQTTLPPGKFALQWIDSSLNYEQQKAINAVVSGHYGIVPYLISGPPGTGKTKTIVETTLQLLRSQPSPHLLVCAPSDSAADTLAVRLSQHLKPNQMFRLNSWTRTFAEVPANIMQYCYSANNLFSLPDFRSMMGFTVIVTTCRDASLLVRVRMTNEDLHHLTTQLSLISGNIPQELPHWTGLLLDEAAQSTEPEAAIALSVLAPPPGCNTSPLFVLAGDEHQLGPRLAYKNLEGDLQPSLFQRLFEREIYHKHPLSRSQGSKPFTASMLPMARPAFTNLYRNYRSHPAILSVPSMLFYHDTLIPEKTIISDAVQTWAGWKNGWPVLFRQSATPDDVESVLVGKGTGSGGVINNGEAMVAVEYVRSLLGKRTEQLPHPLLPHEVMVMSPFRAQVKILRQRFREAGLFDVNIGPLEAFQGLESRVVVLCTTRTGQGPEDQRDRFVRQDQTLDLGIIDEHKRFNVALTRAKEGLIVIGDHECLTCTGDNAWRSFIAFCQRNGCVEGDITKQYPMHCPTIGRLERALRFADRLKSGTDSGLGQGDSVQRRKRLHGIELRGLMLSGDEAMLADGGAENYNLPSSKSGSDDDQEGVEAIVVDRRHVHNQNRPGEDAMVAFDLDPAVEVENLGCLSQ